MTIQIKEYIIGLIFLISPLFLMAHNPLSAKYYLNIGKEASLLSIHLSQDGVHAMMKKRHGDKANNMTADEYKKELVQYVKSHCDIFVSNQKVKLKQGGVKLGNHQTDLKFLVDIPPITDKKITVSIPAFRENEFHQTIFAYNLYGVKDKLLLTVENDYKGEILLSELPATLCKYWIPTIVGLVVVLSIIFFWKRNK